MFFFVVKGNQMYKMITFADKFGVEFQFCPFKVYLYDKQDYRERIIAFGTIISCCNADRSQAIRKNNPV